MEDRLGGFSSGQNATDAGILRKRSAAHVQEQRSPRFARAPDFASLGLLSGVCHTGYVNLFSSAYYYRFNLLLAIRLIAFVEHSLMY